MPWDAAKEKVEAPDYPVRASGSRSGSGRRMVFLLSRNGGGDVVQQPAQPSVEYPLNTAELDQDEQALQQVLQSAKSQRVPTIT